MEQNRDPHLAKLVTEAIKECGGNTHAAWKRAIKNREWQLAAELIKIKSLEDDAEQRRIITR